MGVGCKLVQFVVYFALFVMMFQQFQRRDMPNDSLWFFVSGRKLG